MSKTVVISLVLLLLMANVSVAQAPEDRGRFAAEQWIVLVDDGQYGESWKEAAKTFQDSISGPEWEKKAAADRERLGAKLTRKLKDVKAMNGVKGLPAGQYVQVKYQTSFATRKLTSETVTAVLESDGTWRVAAYSIN